MQAGQGIHVWMRASLAIGSKLNGVQGYGAYFRIRGEVDVLDLWLAPFVAAIDPAARPIGAAAF